jgi:tyrosyl-tRNA synthetase
MFTQVQIIPNEREICESTGKIKYSKKEANTIINSYRSYKNIVTDDMGKTIRMKRFKNKKVRQSNKDCIPSRSYYCKECGTYHITHMKYYGSEDIE